jgi:[ribosomal protein S18]-alanine N-acetyltransferase
VSGQSPVIRAMTEEDIPAVDALEKAMFPVDAWPTEMFYDELRQRETRSYYVAEAADGTVIGYAGLMCVMPIADVQTIAVDSAHEGAGTGSRLLATLVDEAKERGADDVLLEVRADNPRAQRLYRWFGFEQIHVRPRYYRDGADALIMRLELSSWNGAPERGTNPVKDIQ